MEKRGVHPINIICTAGTLFLCGAFVIPLFIILGEYFRGNREESFLYEMLHTHPFEGGEPPKMGKTKTTRYENNQR